MKPRTTGTALKRLDRLEQRSRGRRTVYAWPRMLTVDEWSAVAAPMQAALVAQARDDAHGVVTGQGSAPSLDDVTERYQPSAPAPADTTPLETKVQDAREQHEKRAALAYARRMGILR